MDKVKSVLSGHWKSGHDHQDRHPGPSAAGSDRTTGGVTGENSHLAANPSGPGSGEYHPIYDQFAKGAASGEPIVAMDHATHLSNTANLPQSSPAKVGGASNRQGAASSLHPDTSHRLGPHEDMSTSSIKSGVIGFGQGSHHEHPALAKTIPFGKRLRAKQTVGDAPLSGSAGEHNRDILDTGRSFPLAGGVTTRSPETTTKTTTTSAREPGTKEREVGIHQGHSGGGLAGTVVPRGENRDDDHDREGLAGTAAPTAYPDVPQSQQRTDADARQGLAGAAAAAAATAYSTLPQRGQQTEVNAQPQTSRTGDAEDAPAQRSIASTIKDAFGWSHDHEGRGHNYQGDPCEGEIKSPEQQQNNLLFTSGPHSTDTANRLDPKLHVPGEFPSPTPLEESNATSYLQSKQTAPTSPSAFAEPELCHTGSLNDPQPRSAEQAHPTQSEHHYGRDAAIAGGLGAAGAGSYAAGKHHQDEPKDVGGKTFQMEPNPYTSTGVDPRVDATPRGFSEQRFDPTASEKHSGRNAALTGGTSTQDTPKDHGVENKEYPAPGQGEQTQNHHGRDAAVVAGGAGAAGYGTYEAAKLYGEHRSSQPAASMEDQRYDPTVPGAHDPNLFSTQRDSTPQNQDHYGRDAAIVGGAGAVGAGAYAATRGHGHAQQPSAKEQQKAFHDQQKEFEKQQAKEQKHHDTVLAAEQKKHEKEAEHQAHKQQKEAEHEAQKHQKEVEKKEAKEQAHHDKVVAAEAQKRRKEAEHEAEQEEEPGKKKHHLFGFLHRDKKDKDKKTSAESSPRQSRDSPRHSKEYGDDEAQFGRKRGRSVLHKDPPPGHPAREAMEPKQGDYSGGNRENVSRDGQMGDSNLVSRDPQTSAGGYDGHPSEGQYNTGPDSHTGLTSNDERYGEGYRGVDAGHHTQGYNQISGTGPGAGVPEDQEPIRQSNTPY